VTRWALAAAIALLVAWLAYARSATPGQRGKVAVLAAIRFAAVLLVAAMVLGAPSAPPTPAAPLVAIDVSSSWRRAGGDDSSRVDSVRTQWQRAVQSGGAADNLVMLLGDSLREVDNGDLGRVVPADAASRIRPAIDRAAALGRPLLLVTDGEVDDPESLAEAPIGSLVKVPVREARQDVALSDLTVPSDASAGDTLQVAALIASGATTSGEGRLLLTLDGVAAGSVAIPTLGAFSTTRVTLPLPLPRGSRTALLRATLEVAGDVEPRNDTLSASIEIGDRPPAVFVSTAPDLDVREVLVVLRGALALPTRAYLRIAPGVWREEGNLAPIREDDVRARAAAAGLLIMHGDTSWAPPSAGRARGARALWTPAPPTALARAGEVTRAAEWYASSAPPSPLSAALSGLPWDSLPPLTLAGLPRGAITVLSAQLGRRGEAVPAIAAREDGGMRTLVISGSGYAGWSLRGGRSAEAFTALWGTMFDWLAVGRGDLRAARPASSWMREGDAVQWRRGGTDSLVSVVVTRRAGPAGTAASTLPIADTVRLRFAPGTVSATSPALPAGVYDARTTGGSAVLVVNASREWVPRAPSVRDGPLSRGALSTDAPRLADRWWPFLAALVLLSAEWIARRLVGLR
jgi:hypothetical protein